jgi:hypothetical protein
MSSSAPHMGRTVRLLRSSAGHFVNNQSNLCFPYERYI